jgi:hypothetical protein
MSSTTHDTSGSVRNARLALLAAAIYAWTAAASFGSVALDVVYSRLLEGTVEPAVSASVFAEVADALVLPLGAIVVAGVAAVIVAMHDSRARRLFIASLALPIVALALAVVVEPPLAWPNGGAWLRLLSGGTASALATAGLLRLCRCR